MAVSDIAVGGYSCELFLEPVTEDFKCRLCKQVAKDPHFTICCGEQFCKACIEEAAKHKNPCPSCNEPDVSFVVNKRDQKRILALEVCCEMKNRGCVWTGRLEQLEAHLNVTLDNCQYVDVDCPYKCNQPVQKNVLPTHLAESCPKRDFFCQYCNFKATYEVVCNVHWPKCLFYPVPCPNACEIMAIERGDLDAHLMLCSLQVVDCDFNYAGCSVTLTREKMEKHLADNAQRHMLMMNKALQEKIEQKETKIKQLEARLDEKDEEIRDLKRGKDQLIQELQEENAQQIQELQQEKERQIQELRKEKDEQMRELRLEKIRQIQELRAEKVKQTQELQQPHGRQMEEGEIEDKLRGEKDRQIKELREENNRQLQELREEMDSHVREVQERSEAKDKQIKELQRKDREAEDKIAELEERLMEHIEEFERSSGKVHFAVPGALENSWRSAPMYTHPGGYKFVITVRQNWEGKVVVSAVRMDSEYDDILSWPVKFSITLQLLNQHRDKDHITMTKRLQWVTKSSRNTTPIDIKSDIVYLDLDWNPRKQTQYIKDSCIQFRITELRVHSW